MRSVRLPRDRHLDSTLAFVREGYRFIGARCDHYRCDAFQTRLLLQRTVCLRGRDAARLFYDAERFERQGAMPRRVEATLQGVGGVQGLDGPPHRRRKAMLMSLMTPDSIESLVRQFEREWQAQLGRWERDRRVVLYDEVGRILCRAVHAWAGVPLPESDVRRRTDDLHAMIDGPAGVGPRYWRGRRARGRAEAWLAALVRQVRAGQLDTEPERPLRVVAEYRDQQNRLLPPRTAAVEMLNLLRPTVAVDRFVTFTALALHHHPEWRNLLRSGLAPAEPFVQEVRRYYPIVALLAARTRQSFDWHGFHFPRGRRVVLDLYGTNHHPDIWAEPDEFRPERFRHWSGDAYRFIPQGGADHHTGHRCAGERLTIELMKAALDALTTMAYDVPDQDLSVSLRRIPTLPRSGFVMSNVRPAG
ncbi:MAG TPA: cytochrome P450 [Micromonosporaceae bacterium]